MKKILLIISHLAFAAIGFAAGIFILPILTAPEGPEIAVVEEQSKQAKFSTEFKRDLKGSDFLHWGEGKVSISNSSISLMGKLAPGPDYKLYLTPSYVDTKEGFEKIKSASLNIGDVKTFDNFIVPIPSTADVTKYNSMVIWCESFGAFITAAKYQ